MAVGIYLTEELKVTIGELKEELLKNLDIYNIYYTVPFDKINKNNIKETIIHIKDINTEISIENDIVTYIKLGNTPFTKLMVIDKIADDSIEYIKSIQSYVKEKIIGSNYTSKIEKINLDTMNITLILDTNKNKYRTQILRDGSGDVYINTLTILR